MINPSFQNQLSELLGTKIKKISPVSGGDISDAFLVETSNHRFFLKSNTSPDASTMFATEKRALESIAATKTIVTPTIHACDQFEKTAFLLMDFIEAREANPKGFENFGSQLADLHSISNKQYGWEVDNFIGSLAQSNFKKDNWADFYWEERLMPQFLMATYQKLLPESAVPNIENWQKVAEEFMQNIKPSLIHGDLWSGNYLISTKGIPYLIDPATYFGHSEVDIAMSRLFGGFEFDFYNAYFQKRPPVEGMVERIDLYQLYYLLVHLNLFGASYLGSVNRILERYFDG